MQLIHAAIIVHHLIDGRLNMWRVDWMNVSELKMQVNCRDCKALQ